MPSKRITANLPAELLEQALELTGAGITETLVEGLEALLKKGTLEKARRLQGKILIREDEGRKNGVIGK